MERYVDIDEISDGKRYTAADMVKIGCGDCAGCSDCCVHMENLITLDPYDVYRMREIPFERLMQSHVELMMDRGIIVPALKMSQETVLKLNLLFLLMKLLSHYTHSVISIFNNPGACFSDSVLLCLKR